MPRIVVILLVIIVAIFTHGASLPHSLLIALPYLKTSYTIAVYGDSFVDTMGENLEYLQASLKSRYPGTTFHYYNYGIGAQNVEMGLNRFNNAFDYKERHYPPITQLHPDIIIIGSFAYNPFSPHDRDRHWQTLTKLVNEAKATGASVYMLAEVAPLKVGFGKGPHGVNWPESMASQHSEHITQLLENAIYLATDHLKVPLINVYAKTTVDGKYGNPYYVNADDGIHPSVAGHQLTAETIASTIRLH